MYVNKKTASAIVALLFLSLLAFVPVQAQDAGTNVPVKLGMIAGPQVPNEAQLLAMNTTGVNLTANNTTQKIAVISSYGGDLGDGSTALDRFQKDGERNMGRVFSKLPPSDTPVMKGANEEINDHYFNPGAM